MRYPEEAPVFKVAMKQFGDKYGAYLQDGDVVEFVGWCNAYPNDIRVACAFNERRLINMTFDPNGENPTSEPPLGWVVVSKEDLEPLTATAREVLDELPRCDLEGRL